MKDTLLTCQDRILAAIAVCSLDEEALHSFGADQMLQTYALFSATLQSEQPGHVDHPTASGRTHKTFGMEFDIDGSLIGLDPGESGVLTYGVVAPSKGLLFTGSGSSIHTTATSLPNEQDRFLCAVLADKHLMKTARRQLRTLLQSALRFAPSSCFEEQTCLFGCMNLPKLCLWRRTYSVVDPGS